MNDLANIADRMRAPIQLPLELEVQQQRDGMQREGAQLAIGLANQQLALFIRNTSGEPLRLRALARGQDDEGEYHFRLSFRPRTLVDPSAVRIQGSFDNDQSFGWHLQHIEDPMGRQVFHIAYDTDRSLNATGGDFVWFVLAGLTPDDIYAEGLAEFSLNFDNILRDDSSVLRGHLLGRIGIYEPREWPVTMRIARTGNAACSPLLAIRPISGSIPFGSTRIQLELFNVSGRTLPMRVGEEGPRIRIEKQRGNRFEENHFNLNRITPQLRPTKGWESFWTGGYDLKPRKDFDWTPQMSFSIEAIVNADGWDGHRRLLLLEYANFGESGHEAGDMILEFDATGLFGQKIHEKGEEARLEFSIGGAAPERAPLKIVSPERSGAHVDIMGELHLSGGLQALKDTAKAPLSIFVHNGMSCLGSEYARHSNVTSWDYHVGYDDALVGIIGHREKHLTITAQSSLVITAPERLVARTEGELVIRYKAAKLHGAISFISPKDKELLKIDYPERTEFASVELTGKLSADEVTTPDLRTTYHWTEHLYAEQLCVRQRLQKETMFPTKLLFELKPQRLDNGKLRFSIAINDQRDRSKSREVEIFREK